LATKKRSIVPVERKIATNNHPRIDFIKSVKFVGIGLDKCDASVDRDLLARAREQNSNIEIDIHIAPSVLAHEADSFVVAADFDLSQHVSGSEKRLVSIAATFSAKFTLTKPADESLVKGFAGLEAKLVFFPYLRHFVSDMSYRMSIDSIVLPLTSELE